MLLSKISKFAACFGSAAVLVSSQSLLAQDMVPCHECRMKRLPKANELPLYDKKEDLTVEYDSKSTLPLISEISSVRKQVFQYASYIQMFQDKAVNVYETGVAHSKSTFDYLKDEENKVQRIIIIASGGLVGLIYGRKGGIFKKILYTSIGTGAVFSVFYPSISKEYAVTGWNTAKFHVNNAVVKYGGYDTDKMVEETNAKIEYIKSVMQFEKLMTTLNEMFYKNKDKLSKKETDDKAAGTEESTKSNEDMYTTRTAN